MAFFVNKNELSTFELERNLEESEENGRTRFRIIRAIFSLFPERKNPEFARFWPNSGFWFFNSFR